MLDREAENLAAGNRNPTRQRVRLGARRDGTVTAISVRVEQALALLGRDGEGVRPLAGGTDLLPLMKANVIAPEQLVDIKRLPGMRGVAVEADGGLSIGGLTTLSKIEESAPVRERYAVLVEAIGEAATPQLRNMATLGGNLLQRPRCWYYRSSHFHCWLKGGDECQMREGENRFAALFDKSHCAAVHPSDIAPALVALDAEVQVRGPCASARCRWRICCSRRSRRAARRRYPTRMS
jgi:xanthine dehydrogenase YagS FAD-binding subunit